MKDEIEDTFENHEPVKLFGSYPEMADASSRVK